MFSFSVFDNTLHLKLIFINLFFLFIHSQYCLTWLVWKMLKLWFMSSEPHAQTMVISSTLAILEKTLNRLQHIQTLSARILTHTKCSAHTVHSYFSLIQHCMGHGSSVVRLVDYWLESCEFKSGYCWSKALNPKLSWISKINLTHAGYGCLPNAVNICPCFAFSLWTPALLFGPRSL